VLLVAEFALAVGKLLPLEWTFLCRLDAIFTDGVAVGFQAGADIFGILDKIDAVEVGRHDG